MVNVVGWIIVGLVVVYILWRLIVLRRAILQGILGGLVALGIRNRVVRKVFDWLYRIELDAGLLDMLKKAGLESMYKDVSIRKRKTRASASKTKIQ